MALLPLLLRALHRASGVAEPSCPPLRLALTLLIRHVSAMYATHRVGGILDPSAILNVDICPVCKNSYFAPTVGGSEEERSADEEKRPAQSAVVQAKRILQNRVIKATTGKRICVEVEWSNGICNWVPIKTLSRTAVLQNYLKRHPNVRKAYEKEEKEQRMAGLSS